MTPSDCFDSLHLDTVTVQYARTEIQYELVYYGIYDSSISVGPMVASDIHDGPLSTEAYVFSHPGFVPLYRSVC